MDDRGMKGDCYGSGSSESIPLPPPALSNISWWMRCTTEHIARRANREDRCTGHFWNRPSYCVPILDWMRLGSEDTMACAA